jgi:adenosylcobinamide kinase / adenosylcobinamide-phosphate guanylyltransferase
MITVVIGGARSGKSEVAERLVDKLPDPVTYVATGVITDDEMAARIKLHRDRRPASWHLVEATGTELLSALDALEGSVLLDSLGTWVASLPPDFAETAARDLCHTLLCRRGDTVVVTEEVGLGVHPATEVGRHFRDALGRLNMAVVDVADRALFVVAGRVLPLEPLT